MNTSTSLEESYLVLIEFLLMAKHRVIELGSEHDLTGMQTMMLFMLSEPRPMNNFSKVFNCDASNITGLVDGLEQKHLASRYESKRDRRIKMVKLDDKGREIRAALLHDLARQDNQLHSRLDPEELEVFMALLQKITQA